MKKRILKIFIRGIRGAGSIMDIYPNKKYSIKLYKPGKSSSDCLKDDWINVGKTLSKAITSYPHG